jgi:hypothetical protein
MCEKLKLNSSTYFINVDSLEIDIEKFDEYGLKILDGETS